MSLKLDFDKDKAYKNSKKYDVKIEDLLYKYFGCHWQFNKRCTERTIKYNITIKKNTHPFYNDEDDATSSYDGYYLSDGVYISEELQ